MFRLTQKGMEDAQGQIVRVTRGCASIGQLRLKLQSHLPYAWGIERGVHRSGALARRAGGAYMLRDSWREIAPDVGRELANSLSEGEAGVLAAQHRFGPRWLSLARARTPVKTGRLRDSIILAYR